MPFNFNEIDEQLAAGPGASYGPIPPNSCVVVQLEVVEPSADRAGREPGLTRSRYSPLEYCALRLTVVEGRYQGVSFWQNLSLEGAETPGQKKAVAINKRTMRQIIDAANGLHYADNSPRAAGIRNVSNLHDLDGITFPVRVGVDRGSVSRKDPSRYYVTNTMAAVIGVDAPEWGTMQAAPYEIITDEPIPEFKVTEPSGQAAAPAGGWPGTQVPPAEGRPAPQAYSNPALWSKTASVQAAAQATPPPPAKKHAAPSWAQKARAGAAGDEVPF